MNEKRDPRLSQSPFQLTKEMDQWMWRFRSQLREEILALAANSPESDTRNFLEAAIRRSCDRLCQELGREHTDEFVTKVA